VIEFVFMLTHQDRTVPDADAVLASLAGSGLRYVGFKDVGATPARQRELVDRAHALGMMVFLEVVSTTVDDERASLEAARAAGVDRVIGGTHPEVAVPLLAGSGIAYSPFPGRIVGHPSVLEGSVEEIAADAARLTALPGVDGLDLLAYRHATVDPVALTRAVTAASAGPVVVAGSIDSLEQVRRLDAAGAWGFTIGSAAFEGRLPGGPTVAGQVRALLDALG
jgi:hypothetical protein